MNEKVRTTIAIDKNLYDQLEQMGVIKDRRISMIINQLLAEYLKNYNISQLEQNHKNFIEACVEEAVARALSSQMNWLKGSYRCSAYSAELLYLMNQNAPQFRDKARENARIDYGKQNARQVFWELPLVNQSQEKVHTNPQITQDSPSLSYPVNDLDYDENDVEIIDLTQFQEVSR